ncbi:MULTISPECIES: response regulator transcription factor [Flavobacterium]|uniref:Response regulator n=1 Tax=Flavobacterium salmonis TaxID=2654844 RepID=A0A6V6Z6P9_9FLAO|nr:MULTISPECIES: response regulator transcription factor [Flavobacterium]OOV17702.1 response regulator [Flavobacterium sp. LM4]CAD0007315.1 response regulator [Flavobacterium salmonis]
MKNSNLKILIAEDDVLTTKILEYILEKDGYEVTSCPNGIIAIEKIAEFLPNLIITDIILPFRSGLEIIDYSKENFEHIPIIVLSCLGVEEERIILKAFNLGADDFVYKPFNPNELLLRIKRLITAQKND